MATTKPNLTRIWAGSADPSDILDPDVGSPGKFAAGWEAELPPYEYFNFLQKLFTEALAHVNEQGISVWDTNTTYPVNAIAKGSDGQLYIAKTEQAGNNPTSDGGVNWERRPLLKEVDNTVALAALNPFVGDVINTKGYSSANGVGAGRYLAKTNAEAIADGDPINNGVNHTAANGLEWVLIVDGPLAIQKAGATLDGTDDFAAITAADAVAALHGVSVYFSGGTTSVDCTANGASLSQTTHWIGHAGATIQRLDYTSTTAHYTMAQDDKTNLITYGLTFDGQVTLRSAGATPNVDPTAGSYVVEGDDNTETLWTAIFGVVVRGGSGSHFTECTFKNFLRAGIRFDDDIAGDPTALECVVDKCTVKRTRGIFGDGIFLRGGREIRITNCHVSDYQRIAYVMEYSTVDDEEPEDVLIDNCIAYYGHDAIVNESNAGFWIESADNVLISNCITNYSGIGFLGNAGANAGAGTTRAYTAHHAFNNCTSLNTHNPLLLRYNGNRSVQVDVNNFSGQCYIFNATTGPIHSNWVGVGEGVRVEWGQAVAGSNAVFNLSNIKIEMMDWGVYGTASAEIGAFALRNLVAGSANSAQQLLINIDNFSTQWSKTTPAGDDDILARTLYETSTRGHFGDFVVCGFEDFGGGTDYRARAIINVNNFANHTFGYVMGAVQLLDGELNVNNTRLSLREPNIRSGGKLSVSNSSLFDYRGNIGFDGQIKLHSVEIDDANPSSTDRSNLSITGTHQISDSKVLRQIRFDMNGGSATDRKLRLKLNNVEWFVPFDTESGLYMAQASSTYSVVNMSGCTFRNDGTGAMGAADKMIECAQASGLIQFYGAGNAFDASMVTAGGHVVQYLSTPAYNDDPTTVASPWYTVMGANVVFGAI